MNINDKRQSPFSVGYQPGVASGTEPKIPRFTATPGGYGFQPNTGRRGPSSGFGVPINLGGGSNPSAPVPVPRSALPIYQNGNNNSQPPTASTPKKQPPSPGATLGMLNNAAGIVDGLNGFMRGNPIQTIGPVGRRMLSMVPDMAGRVVRGMDEGGIPGVAAEMYDAAQPGMRFIGGVGRQALNNVGDGVAYLGGGRPAVEAQIQERIQSKAPGTGGVPIMMYAPWGATAVQPVADSGYEVESSATGVQSAPPVNPGEANERSRAAIAQYFDAGSNGALNLERGGTARFSRDNLPLGTSARGAGVPEMYTIQHPNGGTVQVPADQVEKLLPVLLGEKSNDITGQPENKEDFMNKARVGVRRRVDKNNSLPMGVKWAKDHPEEAAAAKERIAKGQGTHRDYWMAGSVKGQSGEEKRVDQMNYEAVQRMARREAAQQTDASEDKRHKNKLEEIAAGKTPKSEPASSKQLKSRNFTYKGDDGKDVSGKLDYTFDPKSGETVPKYTVEQQNLVDGWLDELANLEALEKQGKKKAPGKIKGVNPTIEERRATLNERLSGFGYVTDSSIRAAIPDVTEEELKSIRGALRRGQTLDQILNSSK